MRTQTVTYVLYKFDELSPEAQRRAWENDDGKISGVWDNEEWVTTLRAFENVFDISVYRYNVGDPLRVPYFKYVKAGRAAEAPQGDPLRLARYVWNNFADGITKGRYYSTRGRYVDGKYTYKKRYSKIIMERDNCPLTGVCYDYDILGPVLRCLDYKEKFNSIDNLIFTCLFEFFNAWQAEIEYKQSFEYFAETATELDYEFFENGDLY